MLVQLSTLSTILFSVVLTSLGGFEPSTYGLEGRCSIQLSYRLISLLMRTSRFQTRSGWWESNPRIQLGRLVFYYWTTPAGWSGWQDSNLRPPGPKPGALAKLSHTPISVLFPCPCGFVFLSYLPQRQDILYGMFLRKSTGFLKFFYFFATVFLPVFHKKSVQIVSFVLVFW